MGAIPPTPFRGRKSLAPPALRARAKSSQNRMFHEQAAHLQKVNDEIYKRNATYGEAGEALEYYDDALAEIADSYRDQRGLAPHPGTQETRDRVDYTQLPDDHLPPEERREGKAIVRGHGRQPAPGGRYVPETYTVTDSQGVDRIIQEVDPSRGDEAARARAQRYGRSISEHEGSEYIDETEQKAIRIDMEGDVVGGVTVPRRYHVSDDDTGEALNTISGEPDVADETAHRRARRYAETMGRQLGRHVRDDTPRGAGQRSGTLGEPDAKAFFGELTPGRRYERRPGSEVEYYANTDPTKVPIMRGEVVRRDTPGYLEGTVDGEPGRVSGFDSIYSHVYDATPAPGEELADHEHRHAEEKTLSSLDSLSGGALRGARKPSRLDARRKALSEKWLQKADRRIRVEGEHIDPKTGTRVAPFGAYQVTVSQDRRSGGEDTFPPIRYGTREDALASANAEADFSRHAYGVDPVVIDYSEDRTVRADDKAIRHIYATDYPDKLDRDRGETGVPTQGEPYRYKVEGTSAPDPSRVMDLTPVGYGQRYGIYRDRQEARDAALRHGVSREEAGDKVDVSDYTADDKAFARLCTCKHLGEVFTKASAPGTLGPKFTGVVKDRQGRTVCFREGRRVECPRKPKEDPKKRDKKPQPPGQGRDPREERPGGQQPGRPSPQEFGQEGFLISADMPVDSSAIECEWYVQNGVVRFFGLCQNAAYMALNAALRGGAEMKPDQLALHARTQKAFAAYARPVTAFRGIDLAFSAELAQALLASCENSMATGEPLRLGGYTPVSLDPGAEFLGKFRMVIENATCLPTAPDEGVLNDGALVVVAAVNETGFGWDILAQEVVPVEPLEGDQPTGEFISQPPQGLPRPTEKESPV